jgi:GT2 family glycosyltransferase
MKSAVAILTYNRAHALKETLSGLSKFCSAYPTAIFEDCGQRDGTETFLRGPTPVQVKDRIDLLATEYSGAHLGPNIQVFLGTTNLGVTGNSNRALKWFAETGCDHLCLMNDDLHVMGDFVNFYAKGHEDLDVGLFCFCDFDRASPAISGAPETYRWVTVNSRGYRVKLLPRMTGIMMSMTRAVLDKIGYFDARFGKFGEEHCDYNIRARFAGFVNLDGQMQNCLDLEFPPFQTVLLKHQDDIVRMQNGDTAKLLDELRAKALL